MPASPKALFRPGAARRLSPLSLLVFAAGLGLSFRITSWIVAHPDSSQRLLEEEFGLQARRSLPYFLNRRSSTPVHIFLTMVVAGLGSQLCSRHRPQTSLHELAAVGSALGVGAPAHCNAQERLELQGETIKYVSVPPTSPFLT